MTSSWNLSPELKWGAVSNPVQAATYLNLSEHLAAVPANGLVVDLGAGIGHNLEAAIYVTRPDLDVVAVDPGYAVRGEEYEAAEARELVVGYFEDEQKRPLRDNSRWFSIQVVGHAEDLPIETASADLVISYAAIPEYSKDPRKCLQEITRILKVGGVALNGPMHDRTYKNWQKLIEAELALGSITSYTGHQGSLSVNGDRGAFSHTVIRK